MWTHTLEEEKWIKNVNKQSEKGAHLKQIKGKTMMRRVTENQSPCHN